MTRHILCHVIRSWLVRSDEIEFLEVSQVEGWSKGLIVSRTPSDGVLIVFLSPTYLISFTASHVRIRKYSLEQCYFPCWPSLLAQLLSILPHRSAGTHCQYYKSRKYTLSLRNYLNGWVLFKIARHGVWFPSLPKVVDWTIFEIHCSGCQCSLKFSWCNDSSVIASHLLNWLLLHWRGVKSIPRWEVLRRKFNQG